MSTTNNSLDAVKGKLADLTAKVHASDTAVKEIRQAILDKGVSVTADTTLAELPDKIREIFVMTTTESSPVGEIIAFMGEICPKHYVACDGTEYPIGTYPLLEKFFVTQFGSVDYFGGDGEATFAVPDLRGEFLRGTGENSHENQGNGEKVGVHQHATEVPNHQNYQNKTIGVDVGPAGWNAADTADKSTVVPGTRWYKDIGIQLTSSASPGSTNYLTTRPTNTSVLYCIKYEPTYATGSGGGESTEEPPMTDTDMREILEYVFATEESEVKTV